MSEARENRNQRPKPTLEALEQMLPEWLSRYRDSSNNNEDLIAELLQTVIKLGGDNPSRGDLKILSRTLKELRYAFKVFAPYRHIRKVSIFGSTRVREDDPYYRMAVDMGRRLTEDGFMVITGAGSGIMQGGHEGAGREKSFGVNIQLPFEQKPNRFIRRDPKLITFHFFFTRKLMFVKEADAFVFFPGGFGTHDELIEILTLAQTGKSQLVPILLVDISGQDYWRQWEEFVRKRMLGRGYISAEDLKLFRIVDDIETAIQEIKTFYSDYHSYRFVKQNLIIRLNRPPTAALIDALNRDFRDILKRGEVRETEALEEESDDPETLHLPRLLVPFNRQDFSRLRQMIDLINRLG